MMFKENTFYKATRGFNIDSHKNQKHDYIKRDEIIFVKNVLLIKTYSDKSKRFFIDLIVDFKLFEDVLWEESRAYLLKEII